MKSIRNTWRLARAWVCLMAIGGLCAHAQTSASSKPAMTALNNTSVVPDLTPKLCPRCMKANTVTSIGTNEIHCRHCNLRMKIGYSIWREPLPAGVAVHRPVAYGVVTFCTNISPERVKIRVNGKLFTVMMTHPRLRNSVGEVVYITRTSYTNSVTWRCGLEDPSTVDRWLRRKEPYRP